MSNLIILYNYHEAPPFLHGNPYVKSGYRGYLPPLMCLRSLFMKTNETMNIWIHLLPGLYYFFKYASDASMINKFNDTHWGDHISFISMVMCIQICMFASACYHMFNCNSQKACYHLLNVDCLGIGIGLSGCVFPVLYYAFKCYPDLRNNYLAVLAVVFGVGLYFISRPEFGSKSWTMFRIMTYTAVAASGILPTTHWVLLHGIDSEIVALFVPRIMMLYILAGVGCFFYLTRFPESLWPGKFDFLGHSHQWWHVCSAMIFVVGHHTMTVLFLFLQEHGCTGANERSLN